MVEGLDNRGHAREKIVLLFFGFDAVVEALMQKLKRPFERPLGTPGDLISHQDADVINLLPFAIQGKKRADFEIAGCNVDAFGELTPVVEVAKDFPFVVAVIDDEQVTS